MTDEEIIEELEAGIKHATETREYHQKKVDECDSMIAMNTRLLQRMRQKA